MLRPTDQTTRPLDNLHPIRPVRLHVQVVRQILSLVEKGHLRSGDKIPAERELVELLRVSRASVRQGLSALEVLGVVEVRAGSGTFVTNGATVPSRAVMPDDTEVWELDGPLEILESREIWEPAVARLAAERHSPEDITRMAALNAELESELHAGRLGWAADWGFHAALAAAANNRTVADMTTALGNQMNGPVWALMRARNLEYPQRALSYWRDHREILRAVESGSGEAAAAAMQNHLDRIASDLEGDPA